MGPSSEAMSKEHLTNPAVSRRAVILLGGPAVLLGLTALRLGSRRPLETLSPGSALEVRVARSLTSSSLALGDIVEGKIVSLRTSDGEAVLPPGTTVRLRCVAVRRVAEEGTRPGYLRLTITSLANPAGELRSVQTTTYSRWGEESARGTVNGQNGARCKTTQEAVTSSTAQAPSGRGSEAVISPEVSLTFVLLKPVAMDGLPSSL